MMTGATSTSESSLSEAGSAHRHHHQPRTTTPCLNQGQRIFIEVLSSGDLPALRQLLQDNVVDVNWYNVDGQTALHQGCRDGNLELVKLLVQFGANVRLTNRDGWSPLHLATYHGHRDVVMYLIDVVDYHIR